MIVVDVFAQDARQVPLVEDEVVHDVRAWMSEHEWSSLSVMRGNMSLQKVPDPAAYERANYMLMLQYGQVQDPLPSNGPASFS